MKNLSELMVDLAYSAVLFNSKAAAEEVIELEETEFNNIMSELEELDVLSDDDTISLDTEEYLIYKLEKDCHVTTSIPANKFTEEFYKNELKKIEDALD